MSTPKKFIIRTQHGSKFTEKEVEGEIVFEMYGHQFFCHRDISNAMPAFAITEVTTGFMIGKSHNSRDFAIINAKKILLAQGELNFVPAMDRAREIIKLNFNMFI